MQTLTLYRLESLASLEGLSGCTAMQTLTFEKPSFGECVPSLASMPDLSSLTDLKLEGLPKHLQPWEDGGRKRFSIAAKFPPGARVRLTALTSSAHLNGRSATVKAFNPGEGKYTITLDEAKENGRRDVEVSEGNLEAEPENEDKGGERSGE